MIANSVTWWEIGRVTLLVSVSTLLVAAFWRWQVSMTPAILRTACLLILAQGWLLYRLPISVPWYAAPAVETSFHFDPQPVEARATPAPRAGVLREPAQTTAAPLVSPWRLPTLKEAAILLWLAGPLVLLGTLVRDFRRFVANIADAEAAPNEWHAQWESVCEAAGVRPSIPMLATANVGPLLCWNAGGYRLLVPIDYWSELTSAQREAVLLHELAHYQRGDIWKSLLVRVVALPQWFNPCVWRLVRWFDEGAEQACDRAVVRCAPQLMGEYARALLLLGQTSPSAHSFASSASGSILARRIRQIVSPQMGEEHLAQQMAFLCLPTLLTAVGILRVELVAKEPDASKTTVAQTAPVRNHSLSDDDDDKDIDLLTETQQLEKSLLAFEARKPELQKKKDSIAIEREKLDDRATRNPDDSAIRRQLEEKTNALNAATAEHGQLRDQIEQAERQRDELQKRLQERKRTLWIKQINQLQQGMEAATANDLWFNDAAGMLACEGDLPDTMLAYQMGVYNLIKNRNWKGTNVDVLGSNWERAIRGEKVAELPPSLQAYLDIRSDWQKLLTNQELERQRVRDRNAVELLKAAIVFQQSAEDASAYWRRQIEQHPDNASDYRLAYLESIARKGAPAPDIALLAPLTPNETPATSREFFALCAILRTYAAQERFDGADYAELQRRLFGVLSDGAAMTKSSPDFVNDPLSVERIALKWLYQSYRKANRTIDAEQVLRSLLAADPRYFNTFAAAVDVSLRERRQWQMDRPVRFSFDNVSLRKAIGTMFDSVALSYWLWIDPAADSDETPVQLDASGPWIDVLRQLLAKGGYEHRILSDDIVWIGPPAQRQQAETLLGRALARLPPSDSPLAKKLWQPISFAFTETPIEDASEFVKDYLRVNLVFLATEKTTSIQLEQLPAFLALSLTYSPLELDWCAEEGVIFVGTSRQIETVQERGARYRRQAIDLERRAIAGSAAAKALLTPISFDFTETPLIDVVDFIRDYAGMSLVFAPKESNDLPTTLQLEQVSAGWGLELILMTHRLHWEFLEGVVFIGSEAQVAAARSKIQRRIAEREGYPPARRAELTKNVQIEAENAPLFAVAESLAKSVQAPIEMSEAVRHRKVNLVAEPMPLDVALDLLCLLNNLSWRWTADGAIRFE